MSPSTESSEPREKRMYDLTVACGAEVRGSYLVGEATGEERARPRPEVEVDAIGVE
jgi:hypothetical protein